MVQLAAAPTAPEPRPQTPLLERLGVRYFARLSARFRPAEAIDAIHFLNPDERAAMRKIEVGAIVRACVAGALSTVVSAAVEVVATRLLADVDSLRGTLRLFGIVGAATIAASIVEIAYLYWDSLRSAHALACAAGTELFPGGGAGERAALAAALARAALELPNPRRGVDGIDPLRGASRAQLVVSAIVYKAKISVTNFAVKLLLRRALGRSLVRAWLPFAAVPVTAAWNGIVCWLVMREARVRAMGPSAATEVAESIFDACPPSGMSERGRSAALRAVAGAIVSTRDLHPNLVALLEEVRARVGDVGTRGLDDARAFVRELSALAPAEREAATALLAVAAVLDGRVTRAERRLVREARAVSGLVDGEERLEALRGAFVRGDGVDHAAIRALSRPALATRS